MMSLIFWAALASRIIAGTVLLAIGGWLLARLTKRSATERWVWQGSIIVLGFFLVAEFGGLNVNDLVHRDGSEGLSGSERNRSELRMVVREGEARGALDEVGGASSSGQTAVTTRMETSKVANVAVLWPAALWLAGTVVLLLLRLVQAAACFAVQRRSERIEDGAVSEVVRTIARRLGISRRVKVYSSRFYETPVAYGVFSASIGLPPDFTKRFTAAEQEVILAHELAHLAHRDALWRTVADLICAICWWNPFAWLLRRKFLGACELAADEASAEIGRGELLADVLVTLAARMQSGLRANWSGMGGEYRSGLARRVTRLLEYRRAQSENRAKGGGAVGRGMVFALFVGVLAALQAMAGLLYKEDPDSSPLGIVLQSFNSAKETGESPGRRDVPVESAPIALPHVAELQKVEEELQEQTASKDELPINDRSVAKIEEKPIAAASGEVEESKPAVSSTETADANLIAANETDQVQSEKNDELTKRKEPQLRIEGKWAEIKDLTLDQLQEMGIEAQGNGLDQTTAVKAWLIRMQPGMGWQTNDLPNAKISGPHRAVLDAQEYQEFLDAMAGRQDTEILSAPRVTTVSGQEVHISVADMQTLVTGVSTNQAAPKEERTAYVTEQMEFGTTLRLNTAALQNGKIQMNIEGQAREFMGYDDPGKAARVEVWQDGKKTKGKLPLPKIRERRYSTKIELESGETVVLFGLAVPETRKFKDKVPVLGDIPGIGRLFRSESEEKFTKHLLLMITVEKLEE